jgi:hypothetical protein
MILDSLISRDKTDGGSIWDSFSQGASDLLAKTVSGVSDTVSGYADQAAQVLPNWVGTQLGMQEKDQLANNTFVPTASKPSSSQPTTGQPPSAVQQAADYSLIKVSPFQGSGNAAVFIIVGAVAGFLVLKSLFK